MSDLSLWGMEPAFITHRQRYYFRIFTRSGHFQVMSVWADSPQDARESGDQWSIVEQAGFEVVGDYKVRMQA